MKVKEKDAVRVDGQRLRELVSGLLSKTGMPEEDARLTAEILVTADERGVDSHGVSYALKGYISGMNKGTINPRPKPRVLRETATTVRIDGDRGLGHHQAYRGMELAINKAKAYGLGAVSIMNSRHIGMLAYYPMLAVKQDMLGLAMTSGGRVTPPLFGAEPMLGTNPIAFGAPAKKNPAFLLDMATTVVAGGKIAIANFLKVPVPQGWALDEDLKPTTDASVASKARRMLPLGGTRELGGHKGYGLLVMVDILCGVLSGHGALVQSDKGMSHFLLAMDISAFRPVEDFKAMMDELIDALHNTPRAPGHERIYVAGEPEWEIYQERTKKGIPLHKDVYAFLTNLAKEMGVEASILSR
jgi:LDH2 family malate/lactate/ureidoglycolate dehydrogenase